MYQKKIIHFSDPGLFAQLEDQAIDGVLDYSEFPPEEYRYFSKLSRLGYMNRHKGWTKEICELKQDELLREYREACTARSERAAHMKRLNAQLIGTHDLRRGLNTAQTEGEAFLIALELIEKLINEPGMAYRLREKFKEAA